MSHGAMTNSASAVCLERRDGFGRLVFMAWDAEHAREHANGSRWLVAVDGSACSLRAVTAIARLLALGQGDRVDLVNVQPWMSKEAAETELMRCGQEATAQARSLLDAAAIAWRTYVVMGETANSIVELADALGSLGIGIGSHGLTPTESVLLGSVTRKVLLLAKAPVLIVR